MSTEISNQELASVQSAVKSLEECSTRLWELTQEKQSGLTWLSRENLRGAIYRIIQTREALQKSITALESTMVFEQVGANSSFPRSSGSTRP